jgi:hypothetical protein
VLSGVEKTSKIKGTKKEDVVAEEAPKN